MLRIGSQIAFVAVIVGVIVYFRAVLIGNLQEQGISTSFAFLDRPAGFRITGADFSPRQPVIEAIAVGVKNTVLVSAVGIALATVIGVLVGVARLSTNWLVRRGASLYVESLRNIPPLIVIIFWASAVILKLPSIRDPIEWGGVLVLSNGGFWIPSFEARVALGPFWSTLAVAVVAGGGVAWWRTRRFDATGTPHHRVLWGAVVFLLIAGAGYAALGAPFEVSLPEREGLRVDGGMAMVPEFAAVLLGLTLYTASHIAEIVRGSILAVPRGQTEAAQAVGLTSFQRLRHVVLPQAFRIIVPPLANQYLNLTKNSSLAVFVGYAEVFAVSRIIIGNGNPAPQTLLITLLVYLGLSLIISAATNLVNRRLELPSH